MLIRKNLLLKETEAPQGYWTMYPVTPMEKMDKIVEFMKQKENTSLRIIETVEYWEFVDKSADLGFYEPQFTTTKIPLGIIQFWVALYLQD